MAVPTAALRHRDFALYQIARLLVIAGAEAQSVAVAWQVYQITHRPLDLGYTGLALFLPGFLFMLVAGAVADRFDRRRVILTCYTLQLVASSLLFWLGYHHSQHVFTIYAVLFLIGTGRAFSAPAAQALLPHLVPKEDFVNAVTWGSNIFQVAQITGPAIGGLLIAVPAGRLSGPALVYLVTLVCLVAFLALVAAMRIRLGRLEKKAISVDLVLAGFRYVWKAKIVLGSITLDLFAVLLGGAKALIPVFAQDILHVGARGFGILRAAPGAGALCMSVLKTIVPLRRHAGRKMLIAVTIFGVATIAFGLARSLWISAACLVIVGASDMVSVVIRSSLIQLATPPEMRGRVSAVNQVFIGASNELGEFESGVTAQWWGAVRAVVIGGIGTLAVVGATTALVPQLRRADELSAEALMQAIEDEDAIPQD